MCGSRVAHVRTVRVSCTTVYQCRSFGCKGLSEECLGRLEPEKETHLCIEGRRTRFSVQNHEVDHDGRQQDDPVRIASVVQVLGGHAVTCCMVVQGPGFGRTHNFLMDLAKGSSGDAELM